MTLKLAPFINLLRSGTLGGNGCSGPWLSTERNKLIVRLHMTLDRHCHVQRIAELIVWAVAESQVKLARHGASRQCIYIDLEGEPLRFARFSLGFRDLSTSSEPYP